MFSTNPFHVFPVPSNSIILDHEKHNLYNPNPFHSGASKGLEQSECDHDLYWSEIKKEKASKKDHHSKIHTAQGPRDRRVRLSIEVAKKFFYLQDLLENDKASKTLDWLLRKSKISIDELIKRKKESSSASSSVTDRSEVVFMETGSDEDLKGRKNKSCGGEGKIRKKQVRIRKYKSGFSVNQLRAEARARARERTKKKLNIKKKLIDNESNTSTVVHVDSCCSSLQTSFWNSFNETHNVSNDSSSKFTALPKFTDLHEQQGDCATV